ncbi:hypothetical protein THMA_0548 [Thermotoga maritima MSB8]|uniref:Uncharacterized protein n=1 Tax=Thermotoga maritima (strain ATCC 43589 / DSM 3109 / JCM 10099 / NBRC 100826 / MSB8) TaxID=243274 RepID=Q9WZ05_THEMA|nr:hypothetical protein [Thermotoga maritima]AAD35620.1 hypothetical protein TM_0535 [Thermotoga maritima MSB8]AGL49457.1 hypothetical protein Tmari_0532 [Thermotoga maritima MSB8]AHD17709.1 hypothetical protein THEMA_02000 [Thermotoga maritima MSB8]AKE26457.1 hypothetical protein THMC_0548 [Thermotoga maritima]AKE28322.1 hypothetical protein THMA_0548 [Thermotoga maritima MSB8]
MKKDSLVTFFASLIVIAILLFFVLSVFNFYFLKKLEARMDEVEKQFQTTLESYEERLKILEELLKPNSIISRYITAYEYFEKASVDFERIFSEIEDDPTTGYMRIFVIGNDPVWITVKDGNEVLFSRDVKPGLSPYRFFYYKKPKISTEYDIVIPRDATLIVGIPNRVFLLVFGVGTTYHPTKIVQVQQTRIDNIERDLKLYIPK